ncbi:helix-turn-helix domain-containing protein [Labedaea rhizosphaerae]|uniref:Helix-turn-helix protein n=1 Tax=Labedaea rhizosphaerae TaxID=598644 RepID=A0A4R6RYL3_LABRH|nr:helix-turn-helix transcriptional regulator [Labedaea rhizosphaerae]TDP92221.1 helix-turn-helix protein [Labedaea rhizosphaerae]
MGRKSASAGYRELGAEMRRLRVAAGFTGRQVASRTGWDPTKVSRVETGQIHIDISDVTWYLGVLRVPYEQAVPLITLCRQAKGNSGFWLSDHGAQLPDALSSLIYHESTSTLSSCYESQLVPGLLQIDRYAHKLISSEATRTKADIEAGVQIRLERQEVLGRQGGHFVFYIHENALRAMVGGPDIMHEQMLALAFHSSTPNVEIRVVPASVGADPALCGAFKLFEFEEHEPLVYLNNFIATSFWLEESDYVAPYRDLVAHLAKIAKSVEESRSFVAALADEYDRGSTHALHRMEEE